MISGQVEFYDEASGWGLIRGDDGRLYDLRASQLAGPLPRVGDESCSSLRLHRVARGPSACGGSSRPRHSRRAPRKA